MKVPYTELHTQILYLYSDTGKYKFFFHNFFNVPKIQKEHSVPISNLFIQFLKKVFKKDYYNIIKKWSTTVPVVFLKLIFDLFKKIPL